MQEIIFDDIGSYPLPEGVSKEWVRNAFKTRSEDEKLFTVINDAFQQKIDAGVEVPTYPQYQDMNEQFLKVIRDSECTESPSAFRIPDNLQKLFIHVLVLRISGNLYACINFLLKGIIDYSK